VTVDEIEGLHGTCVLPVFVLVLGKGAFIMGAMVTLYLVCIFLGTIALVVLLARTSPIPVELRGSGFELPSARKSIDEDELTVPGARIDPSDEYAVEGGAGGAEGEGSSPGYEDGADGGVGGAEGGTDGTRLRRSASSLAAAVAGGVLGFGGVGYVSESAGEALPASPVLLAVLGAMLFGSLGVLALKFVCVLREDR
jgi:hypothetical protein